MTTRIQFILVLLALSVIACNNQSGKQVDERPFRLADNGDTVFQVLNKNGDLITEETVKNGMKNGPSWTYYPDGKVKEKIPYKDGKKNGTAEWYFQNGKLYQSTPYENDLIHGVRTKYFEDGSLSAQIPYEIGQPLLGTLEYNRNGEIVQDTATLLFYPENDVEKEGKFRLRLYLSDKTRNLFYYYYKEKAGKFERIGIPAAYNGVGDYILTGIPNKPVPKQIRFYAEKMSENGNPIVLSEIYDFEKAIKAGEGKDYFKGGPRRIY
ncbi:MAG: hypothetical protein U9R60_11060 [Bacteroidota bacterium]|nr:hypothetical protein [Bacteroidota bacterium]